MDKSFDNNWTYSSIVRQLTVWFHRGSLRTVKAMSTVVRSVVEETFVPRHIHRAAKLLCFSLDNKGITFVSHNKPCFPIYHHHCKKSLYYIILILTQDTACKKPVENGGVSGPFSHMVYNMVYKHMYNKLKIIPIL